MNKEDERDFLVKQLKDLPFSSDFIEQSSSMGFTLVSELVEAGWTRITKTKGFSYRWFSVLLKVFEENNMIHLLYNKPT